jgi:segregation and condensation protein B
MGKKEKRIIESILFSTNKPISIKKIKENTGFSTRIIKDSLKDLINDYTINRKNETSMEIVKAGDKYIMQLKKGYIEPSISVSKPEIKYDILKTLSLIAFHQPLKQSNLRRMAGQKIYDHVDELVSMKIVNTKKHGTTEILTTTKLFPEYFGIDSTKPEEIRKYLAEKVIVDISKKNKSD